LTRQHYDVWQEEGGKDMAQRVQEKVVQLVESHETRPLAGAILAALDGLKRRAEADLTGE
jgi:trimethylamine:corrinoid methyltransferase-like protein